MIPLFSGEPLQNLLDQRLASLPDAIHNSSDEFLMNTPEEDLRTHFTHVNRLTPVTLDRSAIATMSNERRMDGGESYLRIRFLVPFTGSVKLLGLKPRRLKSTRCCVAHVGQNTLEVEVDASLHLPQHAERLLAAVLDEIDDPYLKAVREQIEEHEGQAERLIAQEIPKARAQAQKAQEVVKALPFPMIRRADADSFRVPVVRRQIRPTPEATSAFEPYPVLEEADYEAVLEILHSMRTMIERNPTTFKKLALQEPGALDRVEERYRDLFLVMLNTIFTGEVAGEVFNCLGKTDILVRSRDRNVFIGECKFWAGSSKFASAIDQMLRYPTWRDTKAGLLLFINRHNVKAVISKAVQALAGHANFIRHGRYRNELRHDVVMRSNTDPDQLVRVALLPFALPHSGQKG